jgi:putative sugar O-methyltransferase
VKQLAKQVVLSLLKRWGYVVMREDDWDFLNHERDRWHDRRRRIVQHPPVHGQPDIRLSRTQAQPGTRHIEIAERLIRAFIAASRDEADQRIAGAGDDLWTVIQRGELASFWGVMERKDPRALSEYLLQFGQNGTGFGGLTFYQDGYNQIKDESHIALSYFDKAVSLAEAMGCLQYENPEQGRWGENLYRNADEIFDAIEKEFGAPITPPQHTTGVFGIQTSRGVFHYRHLNALYAAWRIRRMLSSPADAVCEYGGGLGTIPYFLRVLGILDYTIYDIPISNVFAGHFLMNSLSPEDVVLYGEKGGANTIKVLPYWECRGAPDKCFGVTINQDSFPEIDETMVRVYLSEIQRTTRDIFISINQEGEAPIPVGGRNLNISRLMNSFPLFYRLHRSRYWIREGYVEEVYGIRDGGS